MTYIISEAIVTRRFMRMLQRVDVIKETDIGATIARSTSTKNRWG